MYTVRALWGRTMTGLNYLDFFLEAHALDVARTDPEVVAWSDDARAKNVPLTLFRQLGV